MRVCQLLFWRLSTRRILELDSVVVEYAIVVLGRPVDEEHALRVLAQLFIIVVIVIVVQESAAEF